MLVYLFRFPASPGLQCTVSFGWDLKHSSTYEASANPCQRMNLGILVFSESSVWMQVTKRRDCAGGL